MPSKFYETMAAERKDSSELQQCISNTVKQLLNLDTSVGRPAFC